MKIGNLNIVSIKNTTELQVVMDSHQFDNLGLNETRLGKETLDSEIRIDGYDIYRKDRNASGGGVAIYVNQHIPHFQRNDINNTALEIIGIDIEPKHAKNFIIICWYRPPTSDIDEASFIALKELNSKLDSEGKEIFLTGDTNCDVKKSIDF